MRKAVIRMLGLAGAVASVSIGWAGAAAALEVHPDNPRWLTHDGGETALVLTGAHTWSVFQDYRPGPRFDALGYLDGLRDQGHNFTRGWFWEDGYYGPLPYVRQGGRYRLSPPYSKKYLARLRSRVRAAGKRGLYVSVMLFQGWSMDNRGGLRRPGPWPKNPYNRDNTDERVTKQHAALHIGVAQQQQLEYVSFVARKLCGEPNIVWEIVNEAHPNSLGGAQISSWQNAILERLRDECDRRLTWASCPLPLGATRRELGRWNEAIYSMGTQLVSTCDAQGLLTVDPPAADGRRVEIADSDHLGTEVDSRWVWKAFLRGYHPVFMDLTQNLDWWHGEGWDPHEARWSELRGALGAVQELVAVVNRQRAGAPASALAAMAPQRAAGGEPRSRSRPASSAWALFSSDEPCRRKGSGAACGRARANGDELLVYAAPGERVRVCRLTAGGAYRLRWKKAIRPGFVAPSEFAAADSQGCLALENPSAEIAILHLERRLDGIPGG